MERCYFDGIPDEVTDKLMASMKVPSYKAIALAILNNDVAMRTLGFDGKVTGWYYVLKEQSSAKDTTQLLLDLTEQPVRK